MVNIRDVNCSKTRDNIILFGLYVLLFIVPLIYISELRGIRELKNIIGQVLVFILFIIWLLKSDEHTLRIDNLNKLVFLFGTLIFISFLFSQNYYFSFLGLNKWLSYLLVYIITISALKNIKDIKKVFYLLMIVGSIAGLYGIANFYGFYPDPIVGKLTGRGKVVSTFGNPNYLSSFLGPLLPLNLYLLLIEKESNLKLGLFTSFTIIYTALLFARTRGVFLGLIFITFFILFCFKKYLNREYLLKKKRTFTILLILIIILTSIFSGDIPFSDDEMYSLGSRFQGDSLLSRSNYQRIIMWLGTIDIIKDSPIIGTGIGTYRYVYPQYEKDFLAKEENHEYIFLAKKTYDAHNEYLQIAAETGIMSVLIFLAILTYAAYVFFIKMPYINREQNLLLIMLGSSLLVIAIHSLVSFPLRLIQTGILFWFLLAILNNFLGLDTKELKIRDRLTVKAMIAIKVLLICILISFIILNTSKFISDRNLAAGWESDSIKEKVTFYKRAVKYNPYDSKSREELAKNYQTLGMYQKAHQQFNLAKRYVVDKKIYNEIGVLNINEGQYFKAIQNFKRTLAFYPNTIDPYANLGIVNKKIAKDLIVQQKIDSAINRLAKSLFYWEECKVMLNLDRNNEEKIDFTNEINSHYLPEVVELFFEYVEKYSREELKVDVRFIAPERQLPIIDVLEDKVINGKRRIRMFLYTNRSYQSLLKRYGIYNQEGNLFKGIIDFKRYKLSNTRIIEFKLAVD